MTKLEGESDADRSTFAVLPQDGCRRTKKLKLCSMIHEETGAPRYLVQVIFWLPQAVTTWPANWPLRMRSGFEPILGADLALGVRCAERSMLSTKARAALI